ncbi:MAG: hypothetical protein RMM06_04715 [Armatimonadota bacterium]|nr:hypothetical protein [Armatimonadota bacterium]MDW8290001.1 hypothetical protein [Armatimonadota bacterium]
MEQPTYRLFDEQLPPLYSGRALRICTFFLPPLGVVMALVNAGRSRRLDLRPKILIATVIYIAAYLLVSYIRFRFFPPESQRALRVLVLAINYALGLYFENLFAPVLEAHLDAGGRLASAWLPALIILGLLAVLVIVLLLTGGSAVAPR